ncbi:MAG: tetratricopeptide repeat protein [Acidobacteria bacterium]|nr:tetratricopeptide repeat protein [Acidobacteriota bacterium]
MNIKGYEKGLGLLGKENFKEAKSAFEKLAEKAADAQFREKCNSHVRYCNRKLNEPEAQMAFDPFARAVFLINKHQFEEPLALLQPLLEKDPKNDVILYTMAAAYSVKGEEQKAMELLNKAISLNPDNKFHAQRDELLNQLEENLKTL